MALTADEIINEMTKTPPQLIASGDIGGVQGCSYDMTIGTIFWEGKIIKEKGASVIIPPGGVVSILTHEELHLPDDVFATAFAINKWSSKGFLVLNPGHVDPGFRGSLSVRALNIRKVDMPLPVGEKVFTVIFQRLSQPTKTYAGNIASREERERDYNQAVIELSPRTIFEMMAKSSDGPYPGREEVGSMIRKHWATIASLIFTFIAAATGLISVFKSSPASTPPNALPAQYRQSEAEAPPETQAQSKKNNPPEIKQ
jgi:dUTPase